MAARSTADVKRELESERRQLGDAVKTLRTGAEAVRRKLPFVAIGAAGASLAVRTAAKRIARRKAARSEKRARFRLLGRD
jgi:hypothetical protein